MDPTEKWDTAMYVPMILMVPDASIPVVTISVLEEESFEKHIAIGEALAPLRKKGILILGSGASFHNFDYFFA